jgi:hypothetical protein
LLSQTALIALIVLGVIVIAAAIAIAVMLSRRSNLRPLPEESRDRYAHSWRDVENRFIDDPAGAVQEADRVVVMMLSEQGAPLNDPKKMPRDLREARAEVAGERDGRSTEGMRRALVHYKRLVDAGVGGEHMRRELERGRPEVAS